LNELLGGSNTRAAWQREANASKEQGTTQECYSERSSGVGERAAPERAHPEKAERSGAKEQAEYERIWAVRLTAKIAQ